MSFFWSALVSLSALGQVEAVVISEIHYHPSPAEGRSVEFVEVHNPSSTPVSLSGWRLVGAVRFTFPEGSVLLPGAYAVVCKDCDRLQSRFGGTASGFLGNFDGSLADAGEALELVDQFNRLVDAVPYDDKLPWPEEADGKGASLQRNCLQAPSWDPLNWSAVEPATPTRVSPVQVCPPPAYVVPPVVLSEINYHPPPSAPLHPANEDGEDEEFLEIHNPGNAAVDVSRWRFVDGISFSFPPGTSIQPGGYLVVCRNEAKIREKFGITNAVGNYTGNLSNSGERVALVDAQGRFVDSVNYSDSGEWPYAPDGFGRSLEKVVATLPSSDPANWDGSHLASSATFLHLEGEGPVGQALAQRMLLSIDGPGEALIDNVILEEVGKPGNLLQNGTFDLGIEGWTAGGITSSSVPAPGAGVDGTGALRLISTGSCPNGECGSSNSFNVSVPMLNRQATFRVAVDFRYLRGSPRFRAGLFRGAGVSLGNISSPGAKNTASSSELPIFISHVNRFPLEPRSVDNTFITAFIRSKAEATATLSYTAGAAQASLPMADDGLHHDGLPGDGVFGVELPPFPHNTQVRFRIRAESGGQFGEFPRPINAGAPLPHEVWGYYVNDNQVATNIPVYHVLIADIKGSDRDTVNNYLNCDVLKSGSFAFHGDLYPDIGVRWRGNTACVVIKRNWKVVFNQGRLFEGLKKINLNALWTDKACVREHLAWDFIREVGAPYCKTDYIRLHYNGDYFGLYLYVEHPDSRFLKRNRLDTGGNLYKSKQPPRNDDLPIGVEKQNSPNDYRPFWEEETNDGGDFTDIADFVDSMHKDGTMNGGPTVGFWSQRSIEEMILGYQVSQVVLDNVDSFAKNHFLYHDLSADRWGFITWDMDLTFGKFFYPRAVKFPERPVGTLNDIMHSSAGEDLNPWFGATVMQNFLLNHLINFFFLAGNGFYQRAYLIRLWDILEEKYRNDNYDPRLDDLAAFLSVEEAEDHRKWGRYLSNVPGFPEDMLSNIEIMKDQIMLHREFLRTYILKHHPDIPSHPRVKITEIMYLPENGNDELEFLELVNTSPGEVDLSGWTIPAVGFVFPQGSVVPKGSTFIVARSPVELRKRYPDRLFPLLFGPYTGKLANEGEEIRVLDAGPGFLATIDYVFYGNKSPWPEVEPGHSLELTQVSPERDNDQPENWVSSRFLGGSPGVIVTSFVRGDGNLDGLVNLTDAISILSHLFRGGSLPRCADAADSNDDGRLDLTDAIYLLNHLFKGGPPPADPYPNEGTDPTEDTLGCE